MEPVATSQHLECPLTETDNYRQTDGPFVKKIVYIVLFFFLVTGIAIVLHHHDIPPKLAGCIVCKVKYSFTGPQYRAAIDPTFAGLVSYARLTGMLPLAHELFGDNADRIPSYISLSIYLNKSPPIHLI
jgi:hypothetical protein